MRYKVKRTIRIRVRVVLARMGRWFNIGFILRDMVEQSIKSMQSNLNTVCIEVSLYFRSNIYP